MASNPMGDLQNFTEGVELNEENRTCWICFGTDEDNPAVPWVQPCSCKGSGKWVHHSCLLLWVDEKIKENRTAQISCPQCKVQYMIIFPEIDELTKLLKKFDDLAYKICPLVAAGVTVGIVYWAASSYGAFTIMQIFGEDEGLRLLEMTEPTVLLVLLPIIPASLIFTRLFHWEEYILTQLRKGSKYPVLSYILPSITYREVNGQREEILPEPKAISSTRIFVGGLLLPTIAKLCGDVLFYTEKSPLKKCFLGGLSFIVIKGVLKMYFLQKTYVQQNQRRVMNHHERS